MLKKLSVIVFALFLTGCAAATLNIPICDQPRLPPADQSNVVENFLGEPLMWDQWAFPIPVTVDPEVAEVRHSAVLQAIEVWNEGTGVQVFRYTGRGPNPDRRGAIWVTENDLPKSQCGGQIYGYAHRLFRRDALGVKTGIDHGWFEFHTGLPDDRALGTAIHELGHLLGFHHDREIESIMYPYNLPNRGDIAEEDLQYVRDMVTEPRGNALYVPDIF